MSSWVILIASISYLFWCFWSQTVAWLFITTNFIYLLPSQTAWRQETLFLIGRCTDAVRLLGSYLGFESFADTGLDFRFFVTWYLSTNDRIGFKRFLMDQSRKGCYALFPEKQAACNCQIMDVHEAPRKSIHIRETFDKAFTDGVTTFVNKWLCSRQALIIWPINFYYFTVWCLQSLCHLKRKLFESTIMPEGVHKYCKRLI